jgi:hypothetical protein
MKWKKLQSSNLKSTQQKKRLKKNLNQFKLTYQILSFNFFIAVETEITLVSTLGYQMAFTSNINGTLFLTVAK